MAERQSRSRLLIAGLVAAWLFPSRAPGQAPVPAEAWTLETDQPIEWLRFLPARLLVVSSDGGLLALDPADGSIRWRRDDLRNTSQARLDAAQQASPLPGAAPATPARTGLVIRLMEELPGGRLVAILADSAGRRSWFDVLDVQTGATVWSSTSLPIAEARGFLTFPDSITLLVHGWVVEPGRSRRVWLRVEAATGNLVWRSDSLLLESPVQFDASAMAASRGTINGNQPLLALPDSSILLYASADGLVCFDIGSGRVRWRAPVANRQVAPIGLGFAPMLVTGDIAYLPATSIEAIDLESGRHLWTSRGLPAMTVQMAFTPAGLLVRGQPVPRAGSTLMEERPFIALLDPQTGKSVWTTVYSVRTGTTPFARSDNELFIASDDGLVRLSLATGVESALTTGKIPGRPAVSLELRDDGILVGGSQSLTLVGVDGAPRYQQVYPAPTVGLAGRLLRLALGAVSIAGGAYYSGGYLADSAFAQYQFSTTSFSSTHAYFVLKDHEGGGPTLAQVDKSTGEIAAVVALGGDKTPEYVIDESAGVLLLLTSDRALVAYRW